MGWAVYLYSPTHNEAIYMKANNRPCDECIVDPMCSSLCEDFYIYLDKKYDLKISFKVLELNIESNHKKELINGTNKTKRSMALT